MMILHRWLLLGCSLAPFLFACSSSTDTKESNNAVGGDAQGSSGANTLAPGVDAGAVPLGAGGTSSGGSGTGGNQPTVGGSLLVQGGSLPAQGGSPPAQGGSPPAQAGSPPAQAGSPPVEEGGAPPAGLGGEPGMGGSEPETGGTATTGPSPGCGQPAPSEPPSTLTVEGTPRTFLVDIPPGYSPEDPTPILFAFHGMGTTGELFRSAFYGNLPSAFGDDTILVHPDALGDPTSWDSSGGDIPFFDAMLEALSAAYCVDLDRVFATGHSSGGFFTNALGCARGDVLRGIAPLSGGGPFAFGGDSCVGQLAVWLAHGSNDETVEISSGETSRDYWGEANSCNLEESTPTPGDAPCVDYADCDAGFPVRWCVHEDEHNVPSFIPQAMHDFFFGL